jgi:hypothetical protein
MNGISQHPEFICVGAQKAGTRWFYDQACRHPKIWMPPIKELRYFLPGFPAVQNRARLLLSRALERPNSDRTASARKIAFLRRLIAAERDPNGGLAEYVGLFEPAGDRMTGDVSPGYHILGRERIAAIAAALPRCKFLYFIRDPIDRLWSAANMMVREKRAAPLVLTDKTVFAKEIAQPYFVDYSFQSDGIERWRDGVGRDRFRVFAMEDLRVDPVAYRREVFAFLGLDADEADIEAAYNRKEGNDKVPMPAEFRPLLTEYFSKEYERLRPHLRIAGSEHGTVPAGSNEAASA